MIAREYAGRLAGFNLIMQSFGLVLLVGSLDYLTGKEIGLAIFYLFPVALVTWFMKQWNGLCISTLAVMVWFSIESMMDPPYSHPNLIYWNTAVRLAFFTIVVAILSSVKVAFEENSKLILQIQISLARINTLRAQSPICAWCQKVRDEQGFWKSLAGYAKEHPVVDVTHGICPECLKSLDQDLA